MLQRINASARLVFGFVVVAGLAVIAYAQVRLDVPYVPTPQEVVDRMLDLANIGKDDFHIDLGSGDGRIVVTAAKRGARSMGIDINPTRIAEANENARKAGVADRVTFVQGNLFEQNIGDASVLTMYLLQTVNVQLRPKILGDMKPGSRVVSHAFSMRDWEPDRHVVVSGRNVYLWLVPARAEGVWQAESGPRKFTLNLKQAFQKLSGTATMDGKSTPVSGRLNGEAIELSVDLGTGTTQLRGAVKGNTITGDSLSATRY